MEELWQKSLWLCWRWQSFPSVRSLWYWLYMCQEGHRCGAGWMLLRASSSKHNLAWCRGQWHKAGWIKGLSHSVSHNRITSSAQASRPPGGNGDLLHGVGGHRCTCERERACKYTSTLFILLITHAHSQGENMHLYFSAILWCIVCVEIIMLWTEMQLLSCGSNEYLTPVEFIWPNNAIICLTCNYTQGRSSYGWYKRFMTDIEQEIH